MRRLRKTAVQVNRRCTRGMEGRGLSALKDSVGRRESDSEEAEVKVECVGDVERSEVQLACQCVAVNGVVE